MIAKDNYSAEHIRNLQMVSGKDPGLIERSLFAFGLLEALTKAGLEFTFKGGTSLMLLLPKPMRLSTDIDIVVKPGTDIDAYIQKAARIFPFVDGGEQERKTRGNLEKRHFRFIYSSPVRNGGTLYILLDVLFEENHYKRLIQKEITNDLLVTQGENLKVSVPSVDCILGDKLTAFAPYTTGIPLRVNKDMEVMKQFYDVSTLIDEFEDFTCVCDTYSLVAETEIGYRDIKITPADALLDTILAAMCIGSRGKVQPNDFAYYLRGSRDILQHIYASGFSMEQASRLAPKVIYMAACLLMKTEFIKISDGEIYRNETLQNENLKTMKAIRKVDAVGYAYLVCADRLFQQFPVEWHKGRFI